MKHKLIMENWRKFLKENKARIALLQDPEFKSAFDTWKSIIMKDNSYIIRPGVETDDILARHHPNYMARAISGYQMSGDWTIEGEMTATTAQGYAPGHAYKLADTNPVEERLYNLNQTLVEKYEDRGPSANPDTVRQPFTQEDLDYIRKSAEWFSRLIAKQWTDKNIPGSSHWPEEGRATAFKIGKLLSAYAVLIEVEMKKL